VKKKERKREEKGKKEGEGEEESVAGLGRRRPGARPGVAGDGGGRWRRVGCSPCWVAQREEERLEREREGD